MIQHISAVTFAVSDMARSIEFYKKLGFELLYGGDCAAFSSLKAGEAFVRQSAILRRSNTCTRSVFCIYSLSFIPELSFPPAVVDELERGRVTGIDLPDIRTLPEVKIQTPKRRNLAKGIYTCGVPGKWRRIEFYASTTKRPVAPFCPCPKP